MPTETILVVDDEAVVRRLIHYCLKKRGYTVLEAASGEQAIQICQNHKGKISLALVDVIMPGIHGPHLERRLEKLDRDIRVLFMSGFPHIEAINRGMDDFISKPFTFENLLAKIRATIDTPAALHTG